MKAVLLAAGRGTRLGEYTRDLPKCMARLGGRSLLAWQLAALREAGIEDIGIVRGYKAESIEVDGATYFTNHHWATTQMVTSLTMAHPWLEAHDCIVSYTDIIYPGAAITALRQAPGDIAVLYDVHWRSLWSARFAAPLDDAETFRVDTSHRLLDIGARPTSFDQVQGQYMGLLKFTPRGWNRAAAYHAALPADRRARLDMTSLLSGLIREGVVIQAVPFDGTWGEVDRPEDLALYESWLARNPGTLTESPSERRL